MPGGGFPYEALQHEMRAMGVEVPVPPSPTRLAMDALRDLWTGAGLEAVETREIAVQRTFDDFNDYWTTILGGPSVGRQLRAMAPEDTALLQTRMRARLPADDTGRITYGARANAVKGRVPTKIISPIFPRIRTMSQSISSLCHPSQRGGDGGALSSPDAHRHGTTGTARSAGTDSGN